MQQNQVLEGVIVLKSVEIMVALSMIKKKQQQITLATALTALLGALICKTQLQSCRIIMGLALFHSELSTSFVALKRKKYPLCLILKIHGIAPNTFFHPHKHFASYLTLWIAQIGMPIKIFVSKFGRNQLNHSEVIKTKINYI